MMENMKEIWEKAQILAAKRYEEEEEKSWDEADKYEREDYVFFEFSRLQKQYGLAAGGEA